jgi:hypothetical protein
MKNPMLLAGLLLLGMLSAGAAEPAPAPTMPSEVMLTSGRVLRKVEVIRWEKDRVVLKHSAGADPIAFSLIAEPLRSELAGIRAASTANSSKPRAAVTTRRIDGQIFYVAGGNSRAPNMAGIEVRLYRTETLRAYEQSRTLPIGHGRSLPIGGAFMGLPPNPRVIEEYMQNEYASWDNLPEPLAKTYTDLEGKFTLNVSDSEAPVLIFARNKMRSSYLRGGSQEFSYVWLVAPNPEGATIMGHDQVHPGIAKALAFFR